MSNLILKMVDNIAADIAAGKVTGPVCGQLAVRKQMAKNGITARDVSQNVTSVCVWTTFPV